MNRERFNRFESYFDWQNALKMAGLCKWANGRRCAFRRQQDQCQHQQKRIGTTLASHIILHRRTPAVTHDLPYAQAQNLSLTSQHP
jgi:hypothetical protein